MKRWFAYVFAFVWFIAGVTVALGRGQIELNTQHAAWKSAYDAQVASDRAELKLAADVNEALQQELQYAGTSSDIQYWRGVYAVCMAMDQNQYYMGPESAAEDCNNFLKDGIKFGIRADPFYNQGFADPTS